MKIQKGTWLSTRKPGVEQFFANRHGFHLMLSAGVRDWILPNKNVEIEVTEEGDLLFTPTKNENEYRLIYRGNSGQSSVCICAVSNVVEIPQKTRLRCTNLDGKILVNLGGVENDQM